MRTIFKRLCCLFILLGANTYGSTLLVLGDSLSAGYGIDPANGWVNLLQDDLGDDHKVVNGSISGDTTGGGLARLPLLLEKFQPAFVILELGGNDGLRGQPLKLMKQNLASMIALCIDAKAVPILFGMRIPPNYGRRYTLAFADVYDQLADETNTLLIPFQLEELAITEGMIQQDGLHPTEKAQPAIKAVVAQVIKPLVQP